MPKKRHTNVTKMREKDAKNAKFLQLFKFEDVIIIHNGFIVERSKNISQTHNMRKQNEEYKTEDTVYYRNYFVHYFIADFDH